MSDAALNKIMQFVASCSEAPKQRTQEWHDARAQSFGGSIMGSIDGNNPYQSLESVLLEKVSTVPPIRRPGQWLAANWGNIFEDVIARHIEIAFGTTIYGTDLLYKHGPHMHYSPDGLMAVIDKVALLEFKCPFTRIPNGRVPGHYKSQVLAGLGMIEAADSGLFIDALFRRCSREEWLLTSPGYIKNSARDNAESRWGGAALAKGYFLFDVPSIEDWPDLLESPPVSTSDVTEVSHTIGRNTFDELLEGAAGGSIPYEWKIFHNDDCPQGVGDGNAIMYWKLMHVSISNVARDPTYITERLATIQKLGEAVVKISTINGEEAKKHAVGDILRELNPPAADDESTYDEVMFEGD